jgi:predicted NBD/HSP70 family sugar kinase
MVDEAASQGDELALRVIRETGEHVGIAISNLLNLINPQMVIVGGPVAHFGQVFLDSIRETVRQRSLSIPASAARIVLSSLGEDAETIGAAALVLQESTKLTRLAYL